MARYPQIDGIVARVRRLMRTRGYSPRTEDAYAQWIRRFLMHHRRIHPECLGRVEIQAYLECLANERTLAPSTQNQAISALILLFREFLDPRAIEAITRAKGPQRVPTVLSHPQATRVISRLRGKYRLIGSLLYGTGMRLSECLSVRTKDIDFDLSQILVRDGKGAKDRYVMLPERVRGPLARQIEVVQELHESDRQAGGGWAPLPGALHRKKPEAGYSLLWQFVFPSGRSTRDTATERRGRYHLHPSAVQRTVKSAVRRSGIPKDASCHTFRHTFATELVRSGCDIRRVQELMGHKDIRQTMIYLHVVEHTGLGIRSPLDQPDSDE